MARIASFETTPNPNAIKCVLDAPLTAGPQGVGVSRSYRTAESARSDPLASAIFAVPGVTGVLIADAWLSVNKAPGAEWSKIKRAVREAVELGPASQA